jgi:conjugative relaxase-like TrwC/TraI family protein
MSYYTASGEPAGQWAGIGASALGLDGLVQAKIIERLFMGGIGPDGERLRSPAKKHEDVSAEMAAVAFRDAHPLAAATEVAASVAEVLSRAGQVKVPYFDLTISAVKSISVLHASLKVSAVRATEQDDIASAAELDAEADGIEADLIESARIAIEKAEEVACYTRTGHHSSTSGEWRDGDGLVAALFPHHISRDGDPQLHVHAAIANLVKRADSADGKYRALDGAQLYRMRLMIAALTDREMERRMISRGYAMVTREDGNGAEVGGVSQDVMNLFSSRSRHIGPELAKLIDQYVTAHGKQPSKRTIWLLGQQAAQNSRKPKAKAKQRAGGSDTGKDLDSAGRLAAWEAQAAAQETGVLIKTYGDAKAFAATAIMPDELDDDTRFRAARIAVAEVQKHHAVFGRAELAFEAHRALPAGCTPENVLDVAELAISGLAGTPVVEVTAPDVVDASQLETRRDGTSIFRKPNEQLFTTTGQLDLEEKIMTLAGKKVEQLVTEPQALAVLKDTNLTDDQRQAVLRLLTSDKAVTILSAPAGAGKTYSVAAFSKAFMSLTGKQVIGLATSQNAALEMFKAGVSSAYNTAAFLGKVKGSGELRYPVPLHAGDVLVLDESSQLSTSDLALIMAYADKAGARVLPTGDMEQLGAVEAGGMVRMLADLLGTVELTEVLRFTGEWERDASLRLRLGDKKVLADYGTRGRISGLDHDHAFGKASRAYLADHLRGKDTLLLAGSNTEASELARMVQADLVRLGHVQTPCEELADGNSAGVGDLVRARLNTRIDADGRELTNRDVLKISAVTDSGVLARRLLEDGSWSAAFAVARDYIANNTELAYAGNVHVAQGRTVDIAHLLATETLSKEALYVAMTRGREGNYAWTVTGDTAPEGAKPYEQATAESVLSSIMERSSREPSTHEQIRAAMEWAGGTGHVLNLWSAATKDATRTSIEETLKNYLSPDEFRRYSSEPSRVVLNQSLREREVSGQDLKMVLAGITSEPLTGARSISSVLHGRLGVTPAMSGSWASRTPEGSPEVAREAAAVLDSRQRELGLRQLQKPEPWLTAHLGTPPGVDASPLLLEDFIDKAGRAAAYREAAGIIHPDQAIGSHEDSPELEAMRRDTIAALEIRDDEALIRASSRGELESKVAEGERVMVHAPADVSGVLKLTANAERETLQQKVDADLAGDQAVASGAASIAEKLTARKAVLEEQHHEYETWAERTGDTRTSAEKAQAELTRRGEAPAEQSAVEWWREFEANLEKASEAIAAERAAALAAGDSWPPVHQAAGPQAEPEVQQAEV